MLNQFIEKMRTDELFIYKLCVTVGTSLGLLLGFIISDKAAERDNLIFSETYEIRIPPEESDATTN